MQNETPVSPATNPQSPNHDHDGPLFPLGRTVATPGVFAHCAKHEVDLQLLIARHMHGDWGDMDDTDCEANARALKDGERLLSVYTVAEQTIYIITEGDRTITSIIMATAY